MKNLLRNLTSSTLRPRFLSNSSGAIAPLFAVLISFLSVVTGMAVEMGRWAIARNELQASLDAAVLAGAAKLQLNQADKAGAIAVAQKAFKANRNRQRFASDITENITFSIVGSSLYAKGDADITTAMGSIVGVQTLALLGTSGVSGETATGAAATITNSKFELSLMLDITGSMCDTAPSLSQSPCTQGVKLGGMKQAASSLVNIMLATDELKTRVRVAVVPFSDGVRLPALPRGAAAGVAPAVQTFTENYQSCDSRGRNCVTKYNYYYYHPTDCVAERMGASKYSDAAPGPGNYVMTLMRRGTSKADNTPLDYGCTMGTSSVIMPLSNNKSAILATISGLSAKGGTAGQIGTAWTWYTLSPNWKDVWSGSADDPGPYPSATDKTLRKIAVLMTDGDYNTEFSVGGYYEGSWAYTNVGKGVVNDTSSAQAQALCTGMKSKNIEVYTIGYEVSVAAKTFLQTCATDASHAFTADTTAELAAVFQGIGQRVMALYLSQ